VPEAGLLTAGLAIAFPANPGAIRQALQGMLAHPPLADLSEDDRGTAELVLAEVLNNVAEHAYGPAGGMVEVRVDADPDGLRCLIIDAGREMPGGFLPEGDLPLAVGDGLEGLPEGGFGWHLIRSLCAELSYARVQGQNRLSFLIATGP
jgi:serine/threonine-protein kinase RsbW